MQEQVCILSPELRVSMTWEKLSGWLKEQGGTITTIIVIVGALFAGARYIISSEVADIRSDVSTLKGHTKTLDDGLEATNHKIDGLLKDALDRAFPRTVGKSDVHATLTQADNIIRFAKERKIELNPADVQRVGLDILELVNSNPPKYRKGTGGQSMKCSGTIQL